MDGRGRQGLPGSSTQSSAALSRDLHVLAARRSRPADDWRRVPFCPILTQTWSLLRPRGIEVPAVLTRASAYLRNALWTTFEPEGAQMIQEAMETEELT